MRGKHEFKYKSKDQDYNPMLLVNKCTFIDQGYVKSKPGELDFVKSKGMTLEEVHLFGTAFMFASIFFRLQTSKQVLELSLTQWRTFMRKQWRWMGNVVMGDESERVESYK